MNEKDTASPDDNPILSHPNILMLDAGIAEIKGHLSDLERGLDDILRKAIAQRMPDRSYEDVCADPENGPIIERIKAHALRGLPDILKARLEVLEQIREEKLNGTWPLIEIDPTMLERLHQHRDTDIGTPAPEGDSHV